MNEDLLEKEISSWDRGYQIQFSLLAKMVTSSLEYAIFNKDIVKECHELGVFTEDLTLNKKGLKIIEILRKK